MNRLWHLTKFELRRHRWTAVVLFGSLLVLPVLRSLLLQGLFDPTNFFMRGLGMVLLVLCFVVTWFSLLAGIIQGDAATGATAAWMTRPISGWRLLGSKLLAVGLLALALPALIQIILMVVFSAPVLVAVDGALGLVSVLALLALPALLLAALTRRLASFWGACVAGMMALSVAISIRPLLNIPRRPNLDGAQFLAGFVVLAIGALLLLVWLYRRRAMGVIVASGVALLVISGAVAVYWPWPLESSVAPVPVVKLPAGATVEISLGRFARSTVLDQVSEKKHRTFAAGLGLEGWPVDHAWRLQRCTGVVRRNDGTELANMLNLRGSESARSGFQPALEAVLHRPVPEAALRDTLRTAPNFTGDLVQTEAAGVAGPARFEGQARVERMELRVIGTVSLKDADTVGLGAERLRIGDAQLLADRVELRMVQDRFARGFTSVPREEIAMREPLLVLLHRDQVQSVVVARSGGGAGTIGLPGWMTQVFRVSIPLSSGVVTPGTTTLADFSVVVVVELPVERCEVPVAFDLPRVN